MAASAASAQTTRLAWKARAQDLVLAEEARERRHAGDRQRAEHHGRVGDRDVIFLSPPILRMSCSPPMPWMTASAAEKEQRLEEGVRHEVEDARRERADAHATNMYPSCETVEYASTFLMSVCTSPIVAAKSAVSDADDGDHLHRHGRVREEHGVAARPCRRRPSPSSRHESARTRASDLPSRRAARRTAETARSCRWRRRTAAAR